MDRLAPALAIVFEILSVLVWVALGIVVAIAVIYYIYLFTYYRKHLEKGIGISAKAKAYKAAVIFGICIVLAVIGSIAFPMLQAMYASRVI